MEPTVPVTLPPSLLPRLHLFELIDQDWCPVALRDHSTDYLHAITDRMGGFDPAAEVIARALKATGTQELLDLGSGGGGPLPRLRRLLEERHGLKPRVLLSDRFPNERARKRAQRQGEGVSFLERPVDAMQAPEDLKGMRTLFSVLHHFRPEQARAVLADAQAKGVPIAAFEAVRRTPGGVVGSLLVPLLVLLFTPFMRPLTPLRLFFTYVVPVMPLLIFWDGLVSTLRAYRPEELRALVAPLQREGYTWEVGEARLPGKPPVTYVLGLPTTGDVSRASGSPG
jgi:hypothetical protein